MRAGRDASAKIAASGLWVLRRIRNARALRGHPLTARFFAGIGDDDVVLEAIQTLVRAALPAGSRGTRIVEACDLDDVPHKQVWRRLGISERTFYRARSSAAATVAAALARVPAAVAIRTPELELDIEAWYDLHRTGFPAAVLTCSADALAPDMRPALRARLHALRATARTYAGPQDAFELELREAERFARGDRLAVADVFGARATAHYVRGETMAAIELRTRAVELSGAERVVATRAGLRAHVRHLQHLGNWHVEMVDARSGLALLERALALVLVREPNLPAVLAQLREEIACAALCVPDRAATAGNAIDQARMLAIRHGLTGRLAWIEVIAAWAKAPLRAAEALRYARRGTVLADASLGGEWLARLLLTASRVYCMHGESAAALALTERARAHIVPGGYLEAFAMMRRAEALIASGAYGDAAPIAASARSRIAAVNSSHYLGAAHATEAQAHRGLGDTARAAEHIVTAVPLLEQGGFTLELARANQLAASLTGDRRYRQRADELDRALRAS